MQTHLSPATSPESHNSINKEIRTFRARYFPVQSGTLVVSPSSLESFLRASSFFLFLFFYLPFDPKRVAIAVTFVTQPFQFNFTTTALSQLTISRLRAASSPLFPIVSSFSYSRPALPPSPVSKKEKNKKIKNAKMQSLISCERRKTTIRASHLLYVHAGVAAR